MKAFLDSSVLVAAFLGDHEHHEASLKLLVKHGRGNASCAAHSLAEVYSVLTRLPGKHRVSSDEAALFLESIGEQLSPIALTPAEYSAALQTSAAAGITGVAVYDALIAHCALKVKAAVLYTWNLRQFHALGVLPPSRIRTP